MIFSRKSYIIWSVLIFNVLISSMVVISFTLTLVAIHTLIVEPQTTFHAGCGEAGEVEVDPTSTTVWILWKGQCVHVGKEFTSLMCAGHSRER